MALFVESLQRTNSGAIGGTADMPRTRRARRSDAFDPSPTLVVHCGNGFDGGFSPYQSTRFEPIQCCFLTLGADMRRREFISLLGGAAVAWPLAAHAQQSERVRRIGVLMASAADDSENQARMAAFLQSLAQSGWIDGRNVRIDTRWATTNADDLRRHAAELAALAPDVILAASGTSTVAPLLHATRTVPIVFVVVIDPVGAGFVASLARPGGNATGFLMFEYGLSGKWLELLKQVAPGLTRAAVLRDAAIASGSGQFGAIQAVAPFLGMEVSPIDVRDPAEIERAVAALA